jgi:2-(1,2-epoxy-1,2-dihydrophenyl)acetyl-CoA isomerase
MTSLVTYETVDDVAVVTLDRPGSLNALTADMVDQLAEALQRAITEDVGAAVLAGNGRAFCAGHDLDEVQDPARRSANRRELERIQDVTRLLMRSPHPVVAAVQGYALGAGLEFALGCDLVVAARGAQLGFPEVEVGLSVTGGATRILPVILGPAVAKELVLLGGRFAAERAQALGLVNALVEADELMATALDFARRLASRPRESLRSAKRSLDLGLHGGLEAVLQREIEDALGLIAVDQGATDGDLFRARGRDTSGTDGERP